MGFADKLKAGIKNTSSLTGQKVDEAKYNSKISDQRREKTRALEDIGEILYASYLEGSLEINDDIKALLDKAKECDAEIERLEQEKQEMREAAHQERENNRAEAEAADDSKE